MQYLVFGKGKVGQGVYGLLSYLKKSVTLMDDADRTDETLSQADQVIVTPGLPVGHRLYTQYGPKILSELNFLAGLRPELGLKHVTTIGITGTKGKSTTTRLISRLLTGLGLDVDVWTTGNFVTPVSETIHTILSQGLQSRHHILVIEASSFMLYGLQDFWFDYSIRTNISPDHLDRHPDYDHYVNSKAELLTHTRRYGIVDRTVAETIGTLPEHITLDEPSYPLENTKFLGAHNARNIGTAVAIVQKLLQDAAIQRSDDEVQLALSQIPPLEHRLQLLRTIDGIKIYDDNMSTNSAAQRVALESFSQPVVLLAGGSSKGEDFSYLISTYSQHVAKGILYGATAHRFAEIFDRAGVPYSRAESLEDAVAQGIQAAKILGSDTLLFSPGCASFDMFKNYYERAERFVSIVQSLE